MKGCFSKKKYIESSRGGGGSAPIAPLGSVLADLAQEHENKSVARKLNPRFLLKFTKFQI
jgi:hypothetical protein